MTVTKTQKVITIETHQQTLIRSRRKAFFARCERCGRETLMLLPEQAAIIRGESERLIFRQIENGELHFIETANTELFICGNSLQEQQPGNPGNPRIIDRQWGDTGGGNGDSRIEIGPSKPRRQTAK